MAKKREPTVAKHNPVAKFAARFQRAKVFEDKTQYRRHPKHKGSDPYPVLVEFC